MRIISYRNGTLRYAGYDWVGILSTIDAKVLR